eukprot:TRINITY_DN3266_c0_g1_i1.p1 TRINITY_DN3266_c0_g1~~TRINITY_DN3266_c0_g1_i1.p1  ORF type:complete len:567 (-),score=83.07 TRINITY_DN3266_c0_g1_i1:295-1995(-)
MLGFALIITGIILLFTMLIFNKKKQSTVQQEQHQTLPPKIIPKQTDPDLYILFGSQTGCAERLSIILTDEGNAQGINAKLYDLEEFDQIQDIQNKICIFLVATHGEGEPTDNTKPFLKWFKSQSKNEPQFLAKFKFAVFGLGNIEYEYYNAMGKNFNQMLEQAGGSRIYKYGEGDDSVIGRLEDNFNSWKQGIWDYLKETQFREKIQQQLKDESKYNIIISNKQIANFESFPKNKLEFQTKKQLQSNYFKIKSITQLRQNLNDGSTLHFIIEPSDNNFIYKVSQNLDIFPMNTTKKCKEVAQILEIDYQSIVEFVPKNENQKFPFPSPILLSDVLKRFCDFQGIIMKKTLSKLSQIATKPENKEKLAYLATDQGKQDFEIQILSQMKTLIDLLKLYEIKPTLSQFLELSSRMTPRTYTISSSQINSGNNLHLTIHLQEDILPNNIIKKGVAAQFFEDIYNKIEEPLLIAQYRESPFILPEDKTTPIIMISIGCGIAPFRGFLQENLALFEKNQEIYSNMILYYGCRHQNGDFIYQDELKEYEEKGILKKCIQLFQEIKINEFMFKI